MRRTGGYNSTFRSVCFDHLHSPEHDQSILIETSSCNHQFFSELTENVTGCHCKQSLLIIIHGFIYYYFCLLCILGLPQRNGNKHASEIASMALDLQKCIEGLAIPHKPGIKMNLRIGIHTGKNR